MTRKDGKPRSLPMTLGLDPFPYQSIQSAEIGLDYRVNEASLVARPEQRQGYRFVPRPGYSQNPADYAHNRWKGQS